MYMASNLGKYKYTGKATVSKTDAATPATPSDMSELDEQTNMKAEAEVLSSLKMEIAGLFQTELNNTLAVEFGVIK